MRWNPFKNKSRPMARALVAALLIASTVATAPVLVSAQDGTVEAEAPVLVSAQDGAAEADSGDFSNDAANPTAVALANGSNLLSGSVVGGDSADLDYVTVNVPEGHVLAAADLVSYESGNGNAVSFIGIQEGTAFTEPADSPNPANLLGLLLFGVDAAGTDILPALGAGANPFGGDNAIGFEGPLGAGDYTFWIQETGSAPAVYSIDLVVEPAAGPADAPAPADDAPAPEDDSTVSSGSTNVQLEFDGLEPLGEGFVYEGWVILDGAPVSTGRFNVEGDGSLTFLSDSLVADEDLARATTVVITIEPAVDPDPGPADPKPLAGDIVDGVAQLSIGHPAAIGDDFSEAGGSFFVATPTTESTDDEYSGVWFLVPPAGEGQPPTAGLDIPELPAGWVYEGWVVIDGQPVSTGRFLDPAAPDDFGGFSGPLGNPPFPGEDFIVNAPDGLTFPLDLRGNGTVVLTIEPADDDSPAPFAMRPLAAPVPAGLEVPGSVDLGPGPGVPSGVATLDISAPTPEAPVDDSTVSSGSTNVQLEFDGLEPLGEGFVYEGWVILDGAPVSTGRFNVEGDGSLTFLSDSLVADEDLARATTVVITIEPAVDPDPGPADPKPLAGDIVDGVAQLSIGHPAAIGDDFSEAGGSFFVATPTTESTDDEYSGVWFLVPPAGEGQPPTAGLDIPELPAGWVYEGWVVIDGQPVSTGRFLDPAAPDDFGGFSGPLGNPPFPGEDFIVNAPDGLTFPLDLRGNGTVVLTIEPADDDSPAPFAMRPLAAPVPAGLEVPGSVDLGPGPGVPSGVATLIIPEAPAPEADAPAPAPAPEADAPAPEDDAPAPAAEDDAPAPAPEDDAPAPEDAAPAAVEFVNNTFGPRYLEVQPNVNVYSSNQSNTATEFILHPQGGGVFLIQSVTTGLYLHGHGEGGSYNVDVVGPVDDTAYWQLVEVDGGYHVVNVGLGQPLQAVRPGFNVITTAPADGLGDAVIWTIMPVS